MSDVSNVRHSGWREKWSSSHVDFTNEVLTPTSINHRVNATDSLSFHLRHGSFLSHYPRCWWRPTTDLTLAAISATFPSQDVRPWNAWNNFASLIVIELFEAPKSQRIMESEKGTGCFERAPKDHLASFGSCLTRSPPFK